MKKLKVVIPKGRIFANVVKLFEDAGISIRMNDRVYRPRVSDVDLELKIMKPQNIPKLVELGSHDVGFTGYDWVVETGADVAEIMDLKFDPVKVVAAMPNLPSSQDMAERKVIVASEYERISGEFLKKEGYDYVFLRTYGTTEVFPPDDADMIIDNTATGNTLEEHDLCIVATILESSTRFIANKTALSNPWKSDKIGELKMVFQAILDARERVMLEMNVPKEKFSEVVRILPCMRSPTVSPLFGEQGYAVKVAIKKSEVTRLIFMLKNMGATDILEYEMRKVVI